MPEASVSTDTENAPSCSERMQPISDAALPFGAFLLAMQPIHLAIGAVEGCITAAVLVFLYEARPLRVKVRQISPPTKQP